MLPRSALVRHNTGFEPGRRDVNQDVQNVHFASGVLLVNLGI